MLFRSYTIEWLPILGLITPTSDTQTLLEGQTITFLGVYELAPSPTETPVPTPTETPICEPRPTPTPRDFGDPMEAYRIVYYRGARRDRTLQFVDVSTSGITILPGGSERDMLRIRAIDPRYTPPIDVINAPAGLRFLYTEAPVQHLVSDGFIRRVSAVRAHIENVNTARQIRNLRMNVRWEGEYHTSITYRTPDTVAGRIMLGGVALRKLDAPGSNFRLINLVSLVRRNVDAFPRFDFVLSSGLIPEPAYCENIGDIDFLAGNVAVLRSVAAPIQPRALIANVSRFQGIGNIYRLKTASGFDRAPYPANISGEWIESTGDDVMFIARNSSINNATIIVGGYVNRIVATARQYRDPDAGGAITWMGGNVGSDVDGTTNTLMVASGVNETLGMFNSNIYLVRGVRGVNGMFLAGAEVITDPDVQVIPTYTGAVRTIATAQVDGFYRLLGTTVYMDPAQRGRFPRTMPINVPHGLINVNPPFPLQ